METRLLFTDGSVNPGRRVGVGAYVLLKPSVLELEPDRIEAEDITRLVHSRTFNDTSSTRLELQTLVWAIEACAAERLELQIHTDSQCAVGLPGRRERLEANGFKSNAGRVLNHADLYRQFFALLDEHQPRLHKIAGHADFRYQSSHERVFHHLDREARRLLKRRMRELNTTPPQTT